MPRSRTPRSPKPPPSQVSGRPWLGAIICFALFAITWLVFAPAVRHSFVNFDDHLYVYENAQIQGGLSFENLRWAFTHKVAGNWHPLTVLSHMLDCQFFGLAPAGPHFVNILLHATAAVLLFLFFRQATGAVWRSAFVAALFAIHPLRVESVAWISERKDVLSGVFFMLTLLAYTRYARAPSAGRYAIMAGVFVCGLLSKPMLVTVPIILFLLDLWPFRREAPMRKLILEKLPLLALSAGAGLATLLAQTKALSAAEVPLWMRAGNGVISGFTYIRQMFWPARLSPFYPHPLEQLSLVAVVFSLLLLGALTVAAFLLWRTRPYVLTGWLWYLCMLLPVLGIVQVGQQGHADRYTYLPQIGLAFLAAWAIADLSRSWRYRPQILAAAAIVVLALLAVSARAQVSVWHDSETLWRRAIAVTSANEFAHNSLAKFLFSKGRLAEAIEQYRKALALTPEDAGMHNGIGLCLMQMGRPSEAIAHWKKALAVDPENLNAQSNLAWVFATCPERSMRDGARAVELARHVADVPGPKSPIVLRTLAAAYAEAGQYAEAIATTREAIELASAQGHAALVTQLQAQIADFELELPVRDPSLAGAKPVVIDQ